MTAVSLTTLRARVRELADMPVTTFVTDAATSLDAFINAGIQRMHDVILNAGGEESLGTASSAISLTIASGTGTVTLPTDFYALQGVDLTVGGAVVDVKRYSRKERNSKRSQSIYLPRRTPEYLLEGTKLRFVGVDGSYTGTVWYVPQPTPLVADADTINYPNGWEHYAVLYAAVLALTKEESDTSGLLALLQAEEARLQDSAKADEANPASVVDVEAVFTNSDSPWEV